MYTNTLNKLNQPLSNLYQISGQFTFEYGNIEKIIYIYEQFILMCFLNFINDYISVCYCFHVF